MKEAGSGSGSLPGAFEGLRSLRACPSVADVFPILCRITTTSVYVKFTSDGKTNIKNSKKNERIIIIMALDLNDKDREELKNMMRDAINEIAPKETDAQRKARIMSIKDPILRQNEISKNMDLFRH